MKTIFWMKVKCAAVYVCSAWRRSKTEKIGNWRPFFFPDGWRCFRFSCILPPVHINPTKHVIISQGKKNLVRRFFFNSWWFRFKFRVNHVNWDNYLDYSHCLKTTKQRIVNFKFCPLRKERSKFKSSDLATSVNKFQGRTPQECCWSIVH